MAHYRTKVVNETVTQRMYTREYVIEDMETGRKVEKVFEHYHREDQDRYAGLCVYHSEGQFFDNRDLEMIITSLSLQGKIDIAVMSSATVISIR